jgi:hydroxybutyrate-dimer hydrolase
VEAAFRVGPFGNAGFGGTPGAAPKITLANVPPILASPPASNLIAFSGNVLTIPD